MSEEAPTISLPEGILMVGLAATSDLLLLAAWITSAFLIGIVLFVPVKMLNLAVWLGLQAWFYFKGIKGTTLLVGGVLELIGLPASLTITVIATIIVTNNPRLSSAARMAEVASGKTKPSTEAQSTNKTLNKGSEAVLREGGKTIGGEGAEEYEDEEGEKEESGGFGENTEGAEESEEGGDRPKDQEDEGYVPEPARDVQKGLIKRYFDNVVRTPKEEQDKTPPP